MSSMSFSSDDEDYVPEVEDPRDHELDDDAVGEDLASVRSETPASRVGRRQASKVALANIEHELRNGFEARYAAAKGGAARKPRAAPASSGRKPPAAAARKPRALPKPPSAAARKPKALPKPPPTPTRKR